MAGSIILRSYLDLDNGALDNTVNYSNEREPLTQYYSSLRRFTKVVGNLKSTTDEDGVTIEKSAGDGANGTVFTLTVPPLAHNVEQGMAARLYHNATLPLGTTVDAIAESGENALVYHEKESWSKYIIDFGPDLLYPKYLAFFNLDERDIYICKAAQISEGVDDTYTYTLVPFLIVPGGRSVGPMIFNPKYGNLFVVSENPDTQSETAPEEQDLYIIAYNA